MENSEKRQMENINRGVIAIKTDNGIYIGWRLLGTDPADIVFHIYRNDKRITEYPIVNCTNYLDSSGNENCEYYITALLDNKEVEKTGKIKVWTKNYLTIPLNKPADSKTPDNKEYTYSANDASVGDIDGDGEYEIILKWDPSNSKDNAHSGYTGNVFLDAYKLSGQHCWRIDLGRNIRAGAHYTQFLVYDFDGDGYAEVVCKTADGTIDGKGNIIGNKNADYRNKMGFVLEGPEYLTIFSGKTGEALITVDYDPPRGKMEDWGDNEGNRVDRFLACVAYLDGVRPSFIMCRGYYEKTVLVAYNYRNGNIEKLWKFDSDTPGNELYAGQGNHSISVADIDNDGKDEIIYGSCAIDHDGKGIYSTRLGHGDAIHVGDLDPERQGFEVFQVHEVPSEKGIEIHKAETGEILWGIPSKTDIGRGLAADIDPRYPGCELWASDHWKDGGFGLYSCKGEKISDNTPQSFNFAIWWDGDLLRELLDHDFDMESGIGIGKIDKWDFKEEKLVNLIRFHGTRSNNSTKGNPCLQADLFGDWREEVIWRTDDSKELRIYTTTDITSHRIFTLMHDPMYRLAIAWQNVCYNQPPHPSFFIGHGMKKPKHPNIEVVKRSKLEY